MVKRSFGWWKRTAKNDCAHDDQQQHHPTTKTTSTHEKKNMLIYVMKPLFNAQNDKEFTFRCLFSIPFAFCYGQLRHFDSHHKQRTHKYLALSWVNLVNHHELHFNFAKNNNICAENIARKQNVDKRILTVFFFCCLLICFIMRSLLNTYTHNMLLCQSPFNEHFTI